MSLVELAGLLGRRWKLVAGLAVFTGLLAAGALAVLEPPVYIASATLTVDPPAQANDQQRTPLAIYRHHLVSDSVIQRATEALIREGVLEEGASLRLGREIDSTVVTDQQEPQSSALLVLMASHSDPDIAAGIANTWARVFIDLSPTLFRGTAAASETALRDRLAPARQLIEEIEADRGRLLNEFQTREEETSTTWDRRISKTLPAAEEQLAAYHAETRDLMQAVVRRLDPGVSPVAASTDDPVPQGLGPATRSLLLEVLSTRVQLAQTPRVLRLEKAASDETLAELVATGASADSLDNTLTTEEPNPLYDQLTVAILQLEGELKRSAVPPVRGLGEVLEELETIQLERSAGLAALQESAKLEVRTLRRRRSRDLEDLRRERATAIAEIERSLAQMTGLDELMSRELNLTVVSSLLGKVELVKLATPAVAPAEAEPRHMILKVAVAALLGGILGLFVALFQSPQAEPERIRSSGAAAGPRP